MGVQALCTTEEEVGICHDPHIFMGSYICLSGGRQPAQDIWHLEFTVIKYLLSCMQIHISVGYCWLYRSRCQNGSYFPSELLFLQNTPSAGGLEGLWAAGTAALAECEGKRGGEFAGTVRDMASGYFIGSVVEWFGETEFLGFCTVTSCGGLSAHCSSPLGCSPNMLSQGSVQGQRRADSAQPGGFHWAIGPGQFELLQWLLALWSRASDVEGELPPDSYSGRRLERREYVPRDMSEVLFEAADHWPGQWTA